MTGWAECKEILWRNRCKFITQVANVCDRVGKTNEK